MKAFYHGADLDGRCSGAIILNKYHGLCEVNAINHGNRFPFETIENGETVIITDYCIRPYEEMCRFSQTNVDLIWIDHHDQSIKASEDDDFGFDNVKGIRNVDVAACESTWKYFYGAYNVPYAVKLISLFDTWKFNKDKNSLPFEFGMKLQDTRVNSPLWTKLFEADKDSVLLNNIIDDGKLIYEYETKLNKSTIKNHSYEIKFEGLKAIVVNKPNPLSLAFDSVWDETKYDIMIIFCRKPTFWNIGIYTTKNSIDVSKIAEKYGGGGHPQASGFQLKDINCLLLGNNNG